MAPRKSSLTNTTQSLFSFSATERPRYRLPVPQRNTTSRVNLDEDGNIDSDDNEDDAPEFLREASIADVQTNSQVPPGCLATQPVTSRAGPLRCGSRVELEDGDFLQVVVIYRELSTGRIYLKGNLMRRNTKLEGLLDKKRNELHYVLKTTTRNQNPKLHDCLVTKALEDVLCARKIIVTNHDSLRFSFRYDDAALLSREEQMEQAKLVCRVKFTDELDLNKNSITGGSIMPVTEEECDQGKFASNLQRLHKYLGKDRIRTVRTHDEHVKADEDNFQDFITASPDHLKRARRDMAGQDVIDLKEDSDESVEVVRSKIRKTISYLSTKAESTIESQTTTRTTTTTMSEARTKRSIKDSFAASKIVSDTFRARFSSHTVQKPQGPAPRLQLYTYGDICAGAGGMASGAQQAGLKVQFLLDNWDVACETLRWNFPGSKVLLKDLHDFCASSHHWTWEQVDVLHISYPCQPHSSLNRHDRDGGNNPDNIATMFSTQLLLSRCKPRIVTFEQTSHIIHKNDGDFFRSLINPLPAAGYSVRWRVCNLAEYENSQPRKRLIVIAACPGETLPTFPETTHGLGPGKELPTTVHTVLRALQPHKTSMPVAMRESNQVNMPGYDSNLPLRRCITCDGGQSNLHPSGRRTFELCELAALQAFLPTHRFAGGKTAILKQIGNAVPSCFGKILFEHITKSLRESDRKLALWNPDDEIVTID